MLVGVAAGVVLLSVGGTVKPGMAGTLNVVAGVVELESRDDEEDVGLLVVLADAITPGLVDELTLVFFSVVGVALVFEVDLVPWLD